MLKVAVRLSKKLRRIITLLVNVNVHSGSDAAAAIGMSPNLGCGNILNVILAAIYIAESQASAIAAAIRFNTLAVTVNPRLWVGATGLALDADQVFSPREALGTLLVSALRDHTYVSVCDPHAVRLDDGFKLAAPCFEQIAQALADFYVIEGMRSAARLVAVTDFPTCASEY